MKSKKVVSIFTLVLIFSATLTIKAVFNANVHNSTVACIVSGSSSNSKIVAAGPTCTPNGPCGSGGTKS